MYGRSAYRTTAILSETLFVWCRVACDIRLESYRPRHPIKHQLFSDTYIVIWLYRQRCIVYLIHIVVSFQLIVYANIEFEELVHLFTSLLPSSKK